MEEAECMFSASGYERFIFSHEIEKGLGYSSGPKLLFEQR